MFYTTEGLIQAVIVALRDNVLPTLEGGSWAASNVRSCLMLLTYAKDRVACEPELLAAQIKLAREFLAEALALPAGADAMRPEILACISEIDELPPPLSVATLAQLDVRCRALIVRLVELLATRREQGKRGDAGRQEAALRLRLHEYLAAVRELDEKLIVRSQDMSPL